MTVPVRRPRVLVPITYGLSVRYLVPTGVLRKLAAVCEPVVGLGWSDPELTAQLEGEGFEVVALPTAELAPSYRTFRQTIALDHQHRLDSPTTRIMRDRQRDQEASPSAAVRARVQLRRAQKLVAVRRPGGAAALAAREPREIESGTNVAEFARFLERVDVEAVVSITPYHDEDGLLLWAARDLGIASLTSVISFDNPTTRARMIVRSPRILVWNRHNQEQLERTYPDIAPGAVGITGAPQFDLHHDPALIVDDATWRAELAIPPDRPVILYGAGASVLIPDEPALVELVDEAIGSARFSTTPFLLVRRHPNEPPAAWNALDARLRHGRVVDPWAPGTDPMRSWPSHDDLVVQMSSLAHSAVHVNVCSTMTVDGAVFGRPQIGPTFIPGVEGARLRALQDLYRQEHWLPIAASGGLDTPADPAQLVDSIHAALEDPDRHRDGRARMIEEILTVDDGGASDRLVAEVAAFLAG